MKERNKEWHKELRDEVLNDPSMRTEYEAFKLQMALAKKMKTARLKAHLTQENVAKIMETQKTVVARLEAAGGKGKHSPSLNTLAKYAHAIGCKLNITLTPKNNEKHA